MMNVSGPSCVGTPNVLLMSFTHCIAAMHRKYTFAAFFLLRAESERAGRRAR